MIKNFQDFSKELQDYISGVFTLTPTMNILMNDRSKDWYGLIGKYFLEQYGEENLEDHEILFDRLKNGSKKDKETSYFMLGTYFLTTYLDETSLKEMFGNPICHSEFGEGFRPRRKYEYCSYFIDISGHKAHIGYDERGTRMEVEKDLSPNEVFEMIKELVDKYVNR